MASEILSIAYEGLAILLIDMQDFYIDNDEKRELIPRQISALRLCENNIPLVVLEYNHRGETTNILKREIKNLPQKNVIWMKKYWNDGFKDTGLHERLQKRGIQTLLLMGINAGFCVYATAKSALSYGYRIVTCGDLIAGYEGKSQTYCTGPEWYIENGVYAINHEVLLKKTTA